jgi:hypothetical protein
MTTTHTAGFTPRGEERRARKQRAELEKAADSRKSTERRQGTDFPPSRMPSWGWAHARNLRGPGAVAPPVHRTSSETLGGAFPFLAETGQPMTGAYIGDNLLSRGTFSFDMWDAYSAGIVRSHSVVIIGVKGTGKSVLGKSWSTRLIRCGRKVAVPHDPNGEWAPVADYVGGKTLRVGPGQIARIDPLDPGLRPPALSDEEWAHDVLQFRRAKIRGLVAILRNTTHLTEVEHTAIDLAVGLVQSRNTHVLIPAIWEELRNPDASYAAEIGDGGRNLAHTLRRLTVGDIGGMFDQPSTVTFDASTPMLVVDTSPLGRATDETKSLLRLATTDWIDRGTPASLGQARVVVHEEAAAALLNEVAAGAGLAGRVTDEKVARHKGKSNWYLLHRIADLDALGDEGSALHSQALGLLADCDTRVNYAQHTGELERSARVLGWNTTQMNQVRKLGKGEGFWQIGPDRIAKVKNVCTPGELRVFSTDRLGGVRA